VARGGARTGAGRKVGSATTKTREIANQVAQSGDTPLEALGELRRWAMEQFRKSAAVGSEEENVLLAMKAAEVAADWAAKEAPYVHPKLSSIEAKVDADVTAIHRIELVGPDDDGTD
jgi:hypothetical protein